MKTLFLKYSLIFAAAVLSVLLIMKISYLALTLLVLIIFLITFFKYNFNYFLFSICVFFPIIVSFGPINELPIVFIIAPFLFIIFLLAPSLNKEKIFSKETGLFIAALSIIFIWTVIGYIKNPISFTLSNKIIIKEYLIIIIGIFIFFINLFYFRKCQINENKFLRFLFISALILGILRVLSYFSNFDVPFLGGVFRYAEKDARLAGALVHRIGGIDNCCIAGVPAVMAYFYRRKLKYVFLGCFFVLGIIGGGRTLFFGLMLLLSIDLFLADKKKFTFMLIFLLIAISLFMCFSEYIRLPAQFSRIFKVQSLYHQNPLRLSTYRYYWEIFLQNPIFGKGIGFYKGFAPLQYSKFIDEQLISGGHGAYLSILSIFGIGGGVFLLIMILGGLLKSFYLFKDISIRKNTNIYLDKMVIFIFTYLILTALCFFTGGSGAGNLSLYYIIGMFSGIILTRKQPVGGY